MFNGFLIDWGCVEEFTELSHFQTPDLSLLCLKMPSACSLEIYRRMSVGWLVANINKWIVQRVESFSC